MDPMAFQKNMSFSKAVIQDLEGLIYWVPARHNTGFVYVWVNNMRIHQLDIYTWLILPSWKNIVFFLLSDLYGK